jgi:hypothetical protein
MPHRLTLAALALTTGFGACAQAQTLGMEMRRVGLVNADWEAMGEAARSLYEPVAAEPGTQVEWSSRTGASGVITVETVQRDVSPGPCVVLDHAVRPARAEPAAFKVRRCRNEAGDWPVTPSR